MASDALECLSVASTVSSLTSRVPSQVPPKRPPRKAATTVDFQEPHWLSDSSISSNSDHEGVRAEEARLRKAIAKAKADIDRLESKGHTRDTDEKLRLLHERLERDSAAVALLLKADGRSGDKRRRGASQDDGDMEEKIRTYRRRLTEAKEKNAQLKTEMKAQLDKKDEALREAQAALAAAVDQLEKGGGSKTSKDERIAELEQGMRGWERIVDSMRRDFDSEKKKWQSEAEEEVAQVRTALTASQDKLQKVQDELSSKRKEVQDLQDLLVVSGGNYVEDLQGQVTALTAHAREVDEQLDQVRAELDRERDTVTALRSKIDESENQAAQLRAALHEAEATNERLKSDTLQSRDQYTEQAAVIEELERELLVARQQASATTHSTTEMDLLRAEVGRLEEEVRVLTEAKGKGEEQMAEGARLRAERDVLLEELREALQQKDMSQTDAEGAKAHMEKMTLELEHARRKAEALEATVDSLESALTKQREESSEEVTRAVLRSESLEGTVRDLAQQVAELEAERDRE
eukprot:Sspe_Gene.52482::Locus_29069_Transcript_1_1_Confidence_1.000_Length_1644::g.52482::m.52482